MLVVTRDDQVLVVTCGGLVLATEESGSEILPTHSPRHGEACTTIILVTGFGTKGVGLVLVINETVRDAVLTVGGLGLGFCKTLRYWPRCGTCSAHPRN